jgi:hypothetical protein
MISVLLLLVFLLIAYLFAPRERADHAHVHGAGQIGLLAALALFGVDYFTSFYYATGEMMSALYPYGLQKYAFVGVAAIAFANIAFGGLYMYSLGVFNEGGGSYTASMRYLWPTLSLVVAVALIQDYVLTIVVSALSGGDQLLSILNAYEAPWVWHFVLGASLAAVTWWVTIRGRGASGRVVFLLLGVFVLLTLTLAGGLGMAVAHGVPPAPATAPTNAVSLGEALMHLLRAAMKGMVALTGLEAVSNGIQFFIEDDAGIVRWGKKHLPRLRGLWSFYSGRSGIGRFVQTSFLFYGGLTTLFLTAFSLRFQVFDGTAGKTLVGNLAAIGFGEFPGGVVLFWAYQILAVALLAAASMTAFQDAQATEWRDVAIGEIPEAVVYRDARGTFTRSVTFTFAAAVLIMFLVRGETSNAIPFYGVGVFMPITVMGLAVRRHLQQHAVGRARAWGVAGATFAAGLAIVVFLGQLISKWEEGGWVALVSFLVLALAAHAVLLSPAGYRGARQVHRIVRDKARVEGGMAAIVEWQAFKMQEYRFRLLIGLAGLMELWGVGQLRRPLAVTAGAGALPARPGRNLPFVSLALRPANAQPPSRPSEKSGEASLPSRSPYRLPPRIVRHRIVLPVNGVHQGSLTALRYAHSLSTDVTAVHIAVDEGEVKALQRDWAIWGEGVRLVILESPHHMVLEPLLAYIQGLMVRKQDNEILTIVVPQSVRPRWWSNLMRTQMAALLRLSLPFETGIVITDVPYDVEAEAEGQGPGAPESGARRSI